VSKVRLAHAIALWLMLLISTEALAHNRSQSFSSWEWTGQQLTGEFTIDSRRATLLYADIAAGSAADIPLAERLAQHLDETVRATQAGQPCDAAPPTVLPAAAGWQRIGLAFRCTDLIEHHPVELQIDALFRYAATHLHFLSATHGDTATERVLTAQRPSIRLATEAPQSDLLGFIRTGAEHVASGWDHIAFLAALLLLIPGWKPRLWTITGFTLGHSVTLGLAVTGRIAPDASTVEALIGFSVAYAAFEAARRRALLSRDAQFAIATAVAGLGLALLLTDRSALSAWTWLACLLLLGRLLWSDSRRVNMTGPVLAAAFGLVHGAGFAGALLDIRWPADQLLPVLVGFNIGVELGQITIVLLLSALGTTAMAVWQRLTRDAAGLWPQTAATGLLCLAGVNWFVSRAILD
jgi:hypothetical protein